MKKYETKKVVIEVEYPATLTNEDIIASVNKMNILYINAGYTARLISPDKQGLKDKIIGKSFGLNGNGDKSAIYLKDLFHIIDTLPEPKVLSEEAHYKELYEQGLQIIDALNKLIDNTKVPSEDEIIKMADVYKFETIKENRMYYHGIKDCINYMKGEQK